MVRMANLVRHPNHTIRQYAMDCLSKLHTPQQIARWGQPATLLVNFWSISSQVMSALARHMLDSDEEECKALLTLLIKLLASRSDFLRKQAVSSTQKGEWMVSFTISFDSWASYRARLPLKACVNVCKRRSPLK
jgi:neurofibromin 1